jgi:hypothetical protein
MSLLLLLCQEASRSALRRSASGSNELLPVGNDDVDVKPLSDLDEIEIVDFEPRTGHPVEVNHSFARQVALSGVP